MDLTRRSPTAGRASGPLVLPTVFQWWGNPLRIRVSLALLFLRLRSILTLGRVLLSSYLTGTLTLGSTLTTQSLNALAGTSGTMDPTSGYDYQLTFDISNPSSLLGRARTLRGRLASRQLTPYSATRSTTLASISPPCPSRSMWLWGYLRAYSCSAASAGLRGCGIGFTVAGLASITGLTPFNRPRPPCAGARLSSAAAASEYPRAANRSKRIAPIGPAAAEDSRAPKTDQRRFRDMRGRIRGWRPLPDPAGAESASPLLGWHQSLARRRLTAPGPRLSSAAAPSEYPRAANRSKRIATAGRSAAVLSRSSLRIPPAHEPIQTHSFYRCRCG